MNKKYEGGFYCEICGAICNNEQTCKHHPFIKQKKDVELDKLKELFNIK